jgi:hypothetical protein
MFSRTAKPAIGIFGAILLTPSLAKYIQHRYLNTQFAEICKDYKFAEDASNSSENIQDYEENKQVIEKAVSHIAKHPDFDRFYSLLDKTKNSKVMTNYTYHCMINKFILTKNSAYFFETISDIGGWDGMHNEKLIPFIRTAADSIKTYPKLYQTLESAEFIISASSLRKFIANDTKICQELNQHFTDISKSTIKPDMLPRTVTELFSGYSGVDWCNFESKIHSKYT